MSALREAVEEAIDMWGNETHAPTCAITEDWSTTLGDGSLPNECTCWVGHLRTALAWGGDA